MQRWLEESGHKLVHGRLAVVAALVDDSECMDLSISGVCAMVY